METLPEVKQSTGLACMWHAAKTFNLEAKENFSEAPAIRLTLQVYHLGFPNSRVLARYE